MYSCTMSCLDVCNCAGSSMEFEVDRTDKCQSFEVKTEDITEHDDKPRPYLCTVCDKRFTTKEYFKKHRQINIVENVYS